MSPGYSLRERVNVETHGLSLMQKDFLLEEEGLDSSGRGRLDKLLFEPFPMLGRKDFQVLPSWPSAVTVWSLTCKGNGAPSSSAVHESGTGT